MKKAQYKCGSRTAMLMACTAVASIATASFAQEANDGGLEEIVVMAQKRAQNVQDTPLSVTAVTGDALASAGITTVQELNRVDPALQIGQATGTVTTFIRGVGNPVTTAGNEASVPVYIDDVYFVRAAFPFFDLSSIDRVEVLKGPQGTLFGRNASGGVINIFTKDPNTSKAEIDARLGYSSFQTVDAKLYANIPLAENLAANISLSYHNQHDGWGKNKTLVDPLDTSKGYNEGGREYWRGRSFSTRGKILWQPTDTTSVKLVGYYQDSWSSIGIYARPMPGTDGGSPDTSHNGFPIIPGAMPVPSQVLPPLGFYDVALGEEMYDDSKGGGGSVRIDQELDFADLVSITAYRKANETSHSTGNNSPYDWLVYNLKVVDKQFSQEFQLKSKADSTVNWIVGAYYLNATGGFSPTTIYGPGVSAAGVDGINIYGQQKVKSYAGFGQVTYPVTEATNLTAGIRYTIDKVHGFGYTQTDLADALVDVLGQVAFDAAQAPVISGDFRKTFKKLTWKLGADHHFNDDTMVYANYSRGYKAGTHNTLPLDSPALDPEVIDAYEIGFKADLLDRRLRFNLAGFWNDIDSPQVQAQRNGLVFLKNAGSARTKGVEFDVTASAARGLTLRLAGTYLDAKFRDFPDAPAYFYDRDAPGNLTTTVVDAKGNRMPYASKWKFSGSINYEKEVAELGKFAVDLTGNWASKFNWDADNVIKEPSHFIADASIAFTPDAMENVTFRVWTKNLTKEKYQINYYAQASGSAYSTAPGAPRTIGAEVQFKF